MDYIYTFMLAVMVVLAVTGLFIGVMNDAANFLNSAIASKAAPIKVIMAIASIGIVIGAATSSGMMEVARSGMFDPANFTFRDVMMLYLSVMLANIILLDVYNTMGLPTSTTVALVFCLLGAALAVSIVVITSNEAISLTEIGRYINSTRAMAIVAGILLSVILAFSCGSMVMYISRVIFSFRYHKVFRRFGALWCGISFTAIVYFALFKGLKNVLAGTAVIRFIDENTMLSLFFIWIACSALLYFLQLFKINILKLNILAGTFALALAFAGNDLVNFVGVPVAGYDSYMMARASGDTSMTMGALATDASANMYLLLLAGGIMIFTLWTSKRALSVSKTELSLSSQSEDDGEYGSTAASRGLVRMAMNINSAVGSITPKFVKRFIESRFVKLPDEERSEGAAYDLIRATVNLTTSAILISIATSLKLPLSTTYVCFMVSMGSSLADKAWGRESAVYRISGVLTVVSGWFVTGFGAFLIAFVVGLALMYGGNIAVIIISALCGWMLVRSNIKKNKKAGEEPEPDKIESANAKDLVALSISEVTDTMCQATKIYDRTMIAVFKENRKALKEMQQQAEDLYTRSKERKYNLMPILHNVKDNEINSAYYYAQVVDYMNEIAKSLVHITRPCYEHIDNNHEGMSREQIEDLMKINDDVEIIFSKVNFTLRNNDFSEVDYIVGLRDELFVTISEAMTNQLLRVKHKETSTKASMLYLTILNETKTMVLHSRNLVKSQRFFLQHS
ncbi:MAG: inorganic phosphate transporter [Alistipes sp.]|nr:inorganic phosphate transporter [Alistipes sp.]